MPVYKRKGKRGTAWFVSVSIQGQRIVRRLGPGSKKEEAQALERRLLDEARAAKLGRAPHKTLDEAIARWLDESDLKSLPQLANHIRAIQDLVTGKALSDAPAVAEQIIATGRQRGWKNATINRRLAALRRVSNVAYRHWGWLDHPVGDRIRNAGAEAHRHVYLSPAQVEAIAAACAHPPVADLIVLAAYTGLRRSELLRLDPAWHVQGDLIVLDAGTKAGRPRTVPILPRIEGPLGRLPFPYRPSTLDKWWDRARRQAGYPWVRFHDLRHTYASWLAQAGVDPVAMRDLLGHSSTRVTDRYAHLHAERLRQAVEPLRINSVSQSQEGDG